MKKGFVEGESIMWIARIFLTIVIIGVVYLFIYMAFNKEIIANETIADMAIRRLYYSSECFALEDINVEPGEIDFNKFNEQRLMGCINSKYPIKAELMKKGAIITNTKLFKSHSDLCQVENKKKQCLFSNNQLVLVSENGTKSYDILKAEVIIG